MIPWYALLLMLIPPVLLLLITRWQLKVEQKLGTRWTLRGKGQLEQVYYGKYNYWTTRRSGSMVHSTTTIEHSMSTTAFHFQGGSSCCVDGRIDVPHRIGVYIEVWENGFGKIEVRG